MDEKKKRYLPEAKEYFSRNATSWYVRSSVVGSVGYCSMTFVDYIQKVHLNESNHQMGGDTDLIAEAVCNITLTADSAIQFAKTILSQFGIAIPEQHVPTNVGGTTANTKEISTHE